MATTILPPKKAPVVKERTNNVKVQPPKASAVYNIPLHKPKSKKGEPIDPEELSRRLQTYLIQQKMRVEERKQKAAYKAAHGRSPPNGRHSLRQQQQQKQQIPEQQHVENKPKSRPESFGDKENGYRHVPSQAATQFARTTTPDPMRAIHLLSQQAVQCHLEQVKVGDVGAPGTTIQAINDARLERAALRQRNQFQDTRSMEEVNLIDDQRGVYGPNYQKIRRSMLLDEDESTRPQRPRSKVILDMSGRDNWAQEDEKSKDTVVKRKPSSWILLGKKTSNNNRSEKDEAVSGVGGLASPTLPDGKSSKNFLARFKRHGV